MFLFGDLNAGYAVVTDHDVVECAKLPNDCSAQNAELFALTRARILSKGKVATIYTDSKYAFNVVHDFGTLWRQRGVYYKLRNKHKKCDLC